MTTMVTTGLLKFELNADKFVNALKPAISVATKSVLTESLDQDHITINVNEDGIDVLAFGGRLACEIKISEITGSDIGYKYHNPGSATINALDFEKALESFPPGCKVIISATSGTHNELLIQKASDESEYQASRMCVDPVRIPELATKFYKKIKINRAVFLEALKRVSWGLGFEEHKDEFLYWRLSAKKDHVRIVTGSGGRFAIVDVNGSSFVEVDSKTQFLIPNVQTSTIMGILSKSSDEELVIKQAEADGNYPAQIIFELSGSTIMLVGFDSNVKWPEFDALIEKKRTNRIRTKVSDWEYPTKGMMATYTEEVKKQHDTHESEIGIELDNEQIVLTSKSGARASRKIPIADILEKGDREDFACLCHTGHIGEIYSKFDPDEDIEITYYDNESKPILITGPETPNESLNVKYQNRLFIGTMKR